jgi:CBS domain containing-hemolysin-like protein
MYSALFQIPSGFQVSILAQLSGADRFGPGVQDAGLWLVHLLLPLAIGLGLTALIGFFVAAELALVAASAPEIEALAHGPTAHPNAQLLLDAKHNLDRYLSVTQTGTTAGSLLLGWLGESSLVRWFDPVVGRLGRLLSHGAIGSGLSGGLSHGLSHVWTGAIALSSQISGHGIAVVLAFLLVTYIEIVLGELVPKLLAAQAPEATALLLIRPLRWFLVLFFPALVVLDGSVRLLVKPLGLRLGSQSGELENSAIADFAGQDLTIGERAIRVPDSGDSPELEAEPSEQ